MDIVISSCNMELHEIFGCTPRDDLQLVVNKIGSFRQYCIEARKFLFPKHHSQQVINDFITITYFVAKHAARNGEMYYDEAQQILLVEFKAINDRRFHQEMLSYSR